MRPVVSSIVAIAALALLLAGLPASDVHARRSQQPGDFDYYALVLSWAPTYCAGAGRGRRDPQCIGPRPYAFVLHGLWPQWQRGWPEFCRTRSRPWVPRGVIRSLRDIMPSKGLIIHEYKKHGTCSGLTVESYFDKARALYDKVRIPPRYIRPAKPLVTSPREIENDFLRANPALRPEMISVSCGRRRRLREIRICFSRSGEPAACGRNELQQRLCRQPKIVLPPVRAGRR